MAKIGILSSARIVSNGGEITSDRYVTSATDVVKGGLCTLADGTIVPVADGAIDTGDGPADWFIALEDETATGEYIAVQQINDDTVLEGYVVDEAADDPTMGTAFIGDLQAGLIANGALAVSKVTTDGIFKIVDVMDNYDPYRNTDEDSYEVASDGVRHDRVRFSIIKASVL